MKKTFAIICYSIQLAIALFTLLLMNGNITPDQAAGIRIEVTEAFARTFIIIIGVYAVATGISILIKFIQIGSGFRPLGSLCALSDMICVAIHGILLANVYWGNGSITVSLFPRIMLVAVTIFSLVMLVMNRIRVSDQ